MPSLVRERHFASSELWLRLKQNVKRVEEIIKPSASSVSLDVIIAERIFSLFRTDGTEVQITAKLGKPYKEESLGDYRCPLQVLGLGNDRVYAPWGEDPFVALQYAIDYIGKLLDAAVDRQQLHDRKDGRSADENRWIWRYPPIIDNGGTSEF